MVVVEVRLEVRDVWVCLRDSGVGFDTAAEREEDTGLDHAAALSEGLDIVSTPGEGTEANLRVTIFHADFDSGHQVDLSEFDFLTPQTSRQILSVVRDKEDSSCLELSPALAVVIGRLLSGPNQRAAVAASLWS